MSKSIKNHRNFFNYSESGEREAEREKGEREKERKKGRENETKRERKKKGRDREKKTDKEKERVGHVQGTGSPTCTLCEDGYC
jgi:hypothetical protein